MAKRRTEENYSEAVRELMGHIPGWLTRWGLGLFFVIILILVIGSFFFHSKDVVDAQLILTTINPPANLITKSSGKIDSIYVSDGELVHKGSIVAIIENQANSNDVIRLRDSIEIFRSGFGWDKLFDNSLFAGNLDLGEIQTNYITFSKKMEQFSVYKEQNYLGNKIRLAKQQLNKQNEYRSKTREQYIYQKEDLALSASVYHRDSLLFARKLITPLEHERAEQRYIQKKVSFKGFEAGLVSNELSTLRTQESIVELEQQLHRELKQYNLDLDESAGLLLSAIAQWEDRYIIRSPIAGNITLNKFWSKNQQVNSGDVLATVVPLEESEIIGRAIIPLTGIGKVMVGQKVNISLSAYPYMEYGKLPGIIRSISPIPKKDGYYAYIELPDGMTSKYKKELKYIPELRGKAEIITKDIPLIYRFINPIKSLLQNQ